jgi:hypothetical protein
MDNSGTLKTNRRRYQFRMRTLLVVMLLFGVGIGWTGHRMYRARQNRARLAAFDKEVSELEALGCSVRTELTRRRTWLEKRFHDPGGPEVYVREVRKVTFSQLPPTPGQGNLNAAAVDHLAKLENLESVTLCLGRRCTDAELEHLAGLTKLRHLMIYGYGLTDAGLKYLRVLANLESRDLYSQKITGAGLEHLQGLTNLRSLTLTGRRIKEDELDHLKELSNLKTLKLGDFQMTDAGLEHLQGRVNLRELRLTHTQVSDAGLEHLNGLTGLKTLDLQATKVTDEGVKKLRQALPNCKIYR